MSITRKFDLRLNAGKSIPLTINVNQYDKDEQWVFTLYDDNGEQYVPSSGAIVGIKADNLGIINTASVVGGNVVVNETQQMTAAVGKNVFELLIDGQAHGTANFIVLVEPKPGDNADLSESDLSLIQQAIDSTSATAIAQGVADWMSENLTPTTPVVDASLTVQGAAADAKKTGDEISDLKSQIAQLEAIPTAVKHAMDTLFQNVAFKNDDVYTDEIAVVHNWATAVNLLSISAVFDSGTDTIYTDDTLDDLKQYLTVTASYDDGTTTEVATYTLSGELNEGQSAITVTYEGKTASFSVMVVAPLYSLPNVAETSLTSGGKTSTIKIEDGLITMAGNLGTVIYVEENGTASTNTNPSNKWFTVNENTDVLFEMRDITWTNSSGSRAVQAKWRNADAVSNLMTASFDMTSSGSGTDGYAKFELNPYTTTRNLSALAVQWSATTTSSNSTASFRVRLFVDGVRYF